MTGDGLDHPVSGQSDPLEEEDDDSFIKPVQWWYASTLFPLIAGTFGPMANTFSICALVEHWREYVPAGSSATVAIKDPRWLVAINTVSLAIALIANASLFLSMTKRLPFSIAQPITIVGFWIASVLLIFLVVYASVHAWRQDLGHQVLSQAYYYAIFAAGIYQIIAYLLCFTVYGALSGRYSRDFRLTPAQRTLMLQTIIYFVWQDVWSLAYHFIESWSFLDAVYWADFTALSVGLGGDFVPTTHLGRALLFPFALGGIILLGLVVGSIHSLVLDRSAKEMAARVTEKTRRQLVKRIDHNVKRGRPGTYGLPIKMTARSTAKALNRDLQDHSLSEVDRRRLEFEAMRKVQALAARERQYIRLFLSAFAFAFLWAFGAFIFYKTEKEQGWSYFVCLYFAYTTLLTIGYGDLLPESNAGKAFFVFWSLLAVPTLTILISNMGDTAIKAFKDFIIWLGEITILPSTEATVGDRFKHGMYKIGLKKKKKKKEKKKRRQPRKRKQQTEDKEKTLSDTPVDNAPVANNTAPDDDDAAAAAAADDTDSSDGSSGESFEELHPGLAKMFKSRKRKKNNKAINSEMGERMATDFEAAEELEEASAKSDGDDAAQSSHHYRHELLQQIKRIYSDVISDETKHYSYDEWAYILHLLGEDESDPRYHIHRTAKRPPGTGAAAADDDDPDTGVHKWSWLSPKSPLMLNKDESEWILSKLVDKLEQNLREAQAELESHKRALREAISLSSTLSHQSLHGGPAAVAAMNSLSAIVDGGRA